MSTLIPSLPFIQTGERWAFTGDSISGLSALLDNIRTGNIAHVGFTHHFRNRSNTTDFYYQQRFNSSDSEDALTVREQLQQARSNEESWSIEEISQLLNLNYLLDEATIKLSNGETRRLMIAEALLKNPAVLILDQPLTGLDVNSRVSFGRILLAMAAHPITILLSVGPNEVPDTVTHVAVLQKNELVFQSLLKNYQPGNFDFSSSMQIDKELLDDLIVQTSVQRFQIIAAFRDVIVKYDERTILDEINWTVKAGERWVLSGPNGAGKSTLLSLINGDNPQAYANEITLFDRKRGSGESIWDIKRNIGFVSPELFQYFPTDSLCLHVIESGFYDTIGLFRPTHPEKENICTKWMKLMQVEQYARKLFAQVPPPVQRLCLLARALVKNPALLILDEPTQGLDMAMQEFFVRLIEEICRVSNVTVIYVSHYRQHIPQGFVKTISLDKGKVVELLT